MEGLSPCTHQRVMEDMRWIEVCWDCGAWRDCTNAPAGSWRWRQQGSFARLASVPIPPDIGSDVSGGGAV